MLLILDAMESKKFPVFSCQSKVSKVHWHNMVDRFDSLLFSRNLIECLVNGRKNYFISNQEGAFFRLDSSLWEGIFLTRMGKTSLAKMTFGKGHVAKPIKKKSIVDQSYGDNATEIQITFPISKSETMRRKRHLNKERLYWLVK